MKSMKHGSKGCSPATAYSGSHPRGAGLIPAAFCTEDSASC